MPTFDPAGHALLSAAAQRLEAENPDALQAQADVAEAMLDLVGVTGLTDEQAEQATRAVVLQVNFQLELGTEGVVANSEGRGGRSRGVRSGAGESAPHAHPHARKLAEQVLGWTPIRSRR